MNVLFLFFANVALFALMAFKLFGGEKFQRENSEGGTSSVGYFDSFPNSFWQLYVLVTTANSPDVMIPAYERSKWEDIIINQFRKPEMVFTSGGLPFSSSSTWC